MPPVGPPAPRSAAAARVHLSALETRLDRAAEQAPDPGRPTVHRLNRTEYTNSVRDLLALEIDGRSLLPADDTDAHGFDNNADVLTVSPALAARYLSAARKISRLAVGRRRRTDHRDLSAAARAGAGRASRASACRSDRAAARPSSTTSRPTANTSSRSGCRPTTTTTSRASPTRHDLEVRLDRRARQDRSPSAARRRARRPRAGAARSTATRSGRSTRCRCTTSLEVRLPGQGRPARAGRRVRQKAVGARRRRLQPRQGGWPLSSDEMFDSNPGVATSSSKVRTCRPGPSDTAAAAGSSPASPRRGAQASIDDACAKSILTTTARRAYRRPLTDSDVQTLMEFYTTRRQRRRLRGGHPARARADSRQPGLPVPHRTGRHPRTAAPAVSIA